MIALRRFSLKHTGNLSEFISELRHDTEFTDLNWRNPKWETDKIWAGKIHENKFKIVRKTGIWKLFYSVIIVQGDVFQQGEFLQIKLVLGINSFGLIKALLTAILFSIILIYFELYWWVFVYLLTLILGTLIIIVRLNNTENAIHKYLEDIIVEPNFIK